MSICRQRSLQKGRQRLDLSKEVDFLQQGQGTVGGVEDMM
jgi:hypothetical protein